MKSKRKRKIRVDRVIIFLLGVLVVSFLCFFLLTKLFKGVETLVRGGKMYVASTTSTVPLYNLEYQEDGTIIRGQEVKVDGDKLSNEDKEYYKIIVDKKEYYILANHLVEKKDQVVQETEMYVRTALTFYKNDKDIDILGLIKKGEKVDVIGYDNLEENGTIHMYKVKYNNQEGYVYGKYMVNTQEAALANYDEEGIYKIHASRGNGLNGGSGANLDYYPYEKPIFENNKMPEEVKSLYVASALVYNIDEYIKLAKESGINAIVVDIKDNTTPAYPAKAMEKYSPTNFKNAANSYEAYRTAIKKINDAGLYSIGRITTFKDSFYAKDHPEDTIKSTSTGTSYNHDGSYWPSAYNRNVWEFAVALAIESVQEMGFKEIQFDYVRFPDRMGDLERAKAIDYGNTYNVEKAQAIQEFVMYACDEVHKYNVYVSIDVFGESAHNYVTAYGQYWPAISNVADVISGMPYPDHFGKNEYGFKEPVWTIPYQLLKFWGENYVMKRQKEIPTPAIVRTWIQVYDTTWKTPKTVYDSYMVSEEIKGLYDAGLTGGFMTWNGSSSISKYKSVSSAFGKEY